MKRLESLAARYQTLFFVHVPKTAGTYVMNTALRQVLQPLPERWRARMTRVGRTLGIVAAVPQGHRLLSAPSGVHVDAGSASPDINGPGLKRARATPNSRRP